MNGIVSRHGSSTTFRPSSALWRLAVFFEARHRYSTLAAFMLSIRSISSAIERMT